MQIDLNVLKTNGQQHIDQIIEAEKEESWKALVASKLANSSPEELDVMKALWTHGFTKGAEAATSISMKLYELINKQ